MAIVLAPAVAAVELEALVVLTVTTEATEPSADFDDVGFSVGLVDGWSCEGRHVSACWNVDAGSHHDCGCDNEDHFLKHCL